MKRCFSCFKEYDDEFAICPHCGQVEITEPREPIHLAPGTILAGRYLLGLSVGSGGFGVVYKAWDLKFEAIVAVKEFFVSRMMTRASGLKNVIVSQKMSAEFKYRKERFLAEARDMAKFGAHRSIPNVFEFFEENNTAYIVMELLTGSSLNEYMKNREGAPLDIDFAVLITNEIGNALKSLHEQKIIHRDVAPDNIYICSGKDIKIKLMDLGAAKLQDGTDEVIDIILKPGYSPVEQYDKGKNIGPWSDIYALGATLYVMLTGMKPDESTNRKINDTVTPPHIINPQVSENLSNTVMKAMAIEKHMRFKTVDEFLSAVNGERKVITLAKERKKRRRKRLIGILSACLALLIVSGVVMRTYSKKQSEKYLEDATISLWYSLAEGSDEEAAIESIVADFTETFPNVEVEITAIPEDEYVQTLEKAAEDGDLPTLFESTGLSDDVLEDATDLDNVIDSEQFESCLFLDQYDDYYDDEKRMPLAIEVPMAFVIKSGPTQLKYDDDYFEDVSDFGKNVNVALHSEYSDIVGMNFRLKSLCSDSEFFSDENTSPVLLSSTMAFNTVHDHGDILYFGKQYVFCNADEIFCKFIYEWSIGEGSKSEIKAAERLLSWMLGNVYQNTLMISEYSEGHIPVNRTTFFAKIGTKEQNAPLAPMKDTYKNFVFEREDQ